MSKNITAKRFLLITLVILTLMITGTCILAYKLDPAMYYRIAEDKTYCTEQYTTAGLLKNYKAEIAIIGSSMMQNTNVDLVREVFNKEAIKYTLSGMTIDEIVMIINRSNSLENSVDEFIINLDIAMFNSEKGDPYKRLPKYIYDDISINDIKYLLGYDVWFKFIPFNLIYNIACNMDNPIANKVEDLFIKVTNFDLMGNWEGPGTLFGEELVKDKYKNNIEGVSGQNIEGMMERMKRRFDNDFYPALVDYKEYNIIFPPYSILMWYDAEKSGYLEILLEFKKYVLKKVENLDNVTLYDFQDYEGIINLDNYKDTTHYSSNFNDMMMKSIEANSNILSNENIDFKLNNIIEMLEEFKIREEVWLDDR